MLILNDLQRRYLLTAESLRTSFLQPQTPWLKEVPMLTAYLPRARVRWTSITLPRSLLVFLSATAAGFLAPTPAAAQSNNVWLHSCTPQATMPEPGSIDIAEWAFNVNGDPYNELNFDEVFVGGLNGLPGENGGSGIVGTPTLGVVTQYFQGTGQVPICSSNQLYCQNTAASQYWFRTPITVTRQV